MKRPRKGAPLGGTVPQAECLYVGYGQGRDDDAPVPMRSWVEAQREDAILWLTLRALMANAVVRAGTGHGVVAEVREADGTRWWLERHHLK